MLTGTIGSDSPEHVVDTVKSYYRSRAFTANFGINPLVTAAQSLILLIAQLRQTKGPIDQTVLFAHLEHELLTYASRASAFGYEAHTIGTAKFLLLAAIDAAIQNKTQAPHLSAIEQFCGQVREVHDFFSLLEMLCLDPEKHQESLALAYLCLSLGFETHADQIDIDEHREQVYQLIKGSSKRRVAPDQFTPSTQSIDKQTNYLKHLTIALFSLGLIFSALLAYSVKLNTETIPAALKTYHHPLSETTDHENL